MGSAGLQVKASKLGPWSSGRDVVWTLVFLTLKSPIAPSSPKEGQWGPTHHRGISCTQKLLLGITS